MQTTTNGYKATTDALSVFSITILIATGVALWAVGVVLLRSLGSAGLLSGQAHVVVYALTIPGTVPLVPIGCIVARLPRSYTLASVAIMAMTALLIDGVVIGFFPGIYSGDPVMARACAGALLWGVGVAIGLAAIMQPRPR